MPHGSDVAPHELVDDALDRIGPALLDRSGAGWRIAALTRALAAAGSSPRSFSARSASRAFRDIYLSGSISELATRRSQFAQILRTSGIDGLIAGQAAKRNRSRRLSGTPAVSQGR
jgi:hypothetical protein